MPNHYSVGQTCTGLTSGQSLASTPGSGTQVTVTDASRTIVGTGTIEAGKIVSDRPVIPGDTLTVPGVANDFVQCNLSVTPITNLPQSSFYSVGIDGVSNKITDSFSQLQAANWHITTTINVQ